MNNFLSLRETWGRGNLQKRGRYYKITTVILFPRNDSLGRVILTTNQVKTVAYQIICHLFTQSTGTEIQWDYLDQQQLLAA